MIVSRFIGVNLVEIFLYYYDAILSDLFYLINKVYFFELLMVLYFDFSN